MSEGIHKSVLSLRSRTSASPALVLAVLFHATVFGAALILPRLFDHAPPLRTPIIAHMVALGRPRDPHLLPRKESPPPAASASAKTAPSLKPSPAPSRPEPSRRELMERALAHAAGKTTPEPREAPDPERAGSTTGSAEGTAATAEEGDAYFTAVHDAILENYVVPSVISERERLYLAASVVAFIGGDGRILKHEFQKKSGNTFFDQALETAIQKTKLPPPPADLARSLRDSGVVLNFRP
ncbi:MAG TPA: energy transducer TonB [Myxococcales bacterium]|nr:energy transducer TonB [Myxococcales bacterium]